MSDASPSLESPAAEEDPPSSDAPPGWPPWFQKVVLPYVQESSLRIVFFVLLAHVVLVMSVAQLYTVRDRHLGAGVGLIALIVASVEVCRTEFSWHHKLGVLTALVVVCWVTAVGIALLASNYGVL